MFYPTLSPLAPTPGYLPYPPRPGYAPAATTGEINSTGLRERYLAAAAEARLAEAQYLAAEAAAQRRNYYPDATFAPLPPPPVPYAPYPYPSPNGFGYPSQYVAQPFYGGAHPGSQVFRDPLVGLPPSGPGRHYERRRPMTDATLLFSLSTPEENETEEEHQSILARDEARKRALGLLRTKIVAQKSKQKCQSHCPAQDPLALDLCMRSFYDTYAPTAEVPPATCRRGHRCACSTVSQAPTAPVDLANPLGTFLGHLAGMQRPNTTTPQAAVPTIPVTPSNEHKHHDLNFQDLLKTLGVAATQFESKLAKTPEATPEADAGPVPPFVDAMKYWKAVSDIYSGGQASQSAPFYNQFGGCPHPFAPQPSTSSSQASSSNQRSKVPEVESVPPTIETREAPEGDRQASLNREYESQFRDTIQAFLSSLVGPTFPTPPQAPTPSTSSRSFNVKDDTAVLKEELKTRLLNEPAGEVRDTIEALLASLVDSDSSATATSQPSTASSSLSNTKGKGKAIESEPAAPIVPTISDISRAIDTVQTIETAFTALEADFAFPTQLDFTPPSSPLSTITPLPGTEAPDSLTRHLAYTARNQPVRYYEHALGELLAQLDRIDSFGNDELRARRKEVVGKVEMALEDLEKEVESRWMIRQSKLEKEQTHAQDVSPVTAERHVPIEVSKDEASIPTPVTPVPTEEFPAIAPEPTLLLATEPTTTPPQDSTPVIIEVDDPQTSPREPLSSEVSVSSSNDDITISEVDAVSVEDSEPESVYPPAPAPASEEPSFYPPPGVSSVATIRPPKDNFEAIDTFLLPAGPALSPAKSTRKDEEVESTSDWSEVDA